MRFPALISLLLALFIGTARAQPITQPFLGSFWGTPAAPANIDRFADRVFIGPAVAESGQCQMCATTHDWFEALQSQSYNGGAGIYSDDPFAQAIILADPNSVINGLGAPVVALVTAAETLNSNGTIRTQDITVINNSITPGANPAAWGVYLEAHAVGTSLGTTYALEIESRNSSGPVHWDPFSAPRVKGNNVTLQLGCGAGLPAAGQYDCGPALAIGGNPMPFDSGIMFFNSTIAPNGPGYTIPAIAMPHDYQMQWYNGAGSLTGAITGDAGYGIHIIAGALYVPGSVTLASPPYGVRAYGACFNSGLTLILC